MIETLPFRPSTISALQSEMNRAIRKHGIENTPMAGTDDYNMKVLAEEIGEVAEIPGVDPEYVRQLTVRLGRVARYMTYDNGDQDALEKELLQVAAVALAWHQRVADR